MDMLLSAICDSRGNKHFLESRDGNDTARCECGRRFETTDGSAVRMFVNHMERMFTST